VASGRCVATPDGYVAAGLAGSEHVATVVVAGPELAGAEQRTLERGAIVAALAVLLARTVAEAGQRMGNELVRDLLSPGESDWAVTRERARRHGAHLDGDLVVAVAHSDPGHRVAVLRAATRLADRLHGVAGDHEDAITLVAPGEVPTEVGEQLLAAPEGEHPVPMTIGVAGPVPAADLSRAHADARATVRTLLTLGRHGEVADPAGLGVSRLLLGANGPSELGEFVTRSLGPLTAYDEARGTGLVATLEAWFDHGGRLKETAAALHVHPNTVTQRLERIGDLLGTDWRAPDRSLDLQLALRIRRLAAQSG